MSTKQLLTTIAARLDAVERKVDRIELATLVREPGNAMSVDAYNGLRKQVVAAAGERMAHLAQLSQIDTAVRDGVAADQFVSLLDEWLRQAELERSSDTNRPELFQIVGGDGPVLAVIQPAYIDRVTGRIVRQGVARRDLGEAGGERDARAGAVSGSGDAGEAEAEATL